MTTDGECATDVGDPARRLSPPWLGVRRRRTRPFVSTRRPDSRPTAAPAGPPDCIAAGTAASGAAGPGRPTGRHRATAPRLPGSSSGRARRRMGAVAMLEGEDQGPAGIVVVQRRPGPTEGRLAAHAVAAQGVRRHLEREGQTAAGAVRRGDECQDPLQQDGHTAPSPPTTTPQARQRGGKTASSMVRARSRAPAGRKGGTGRHRIHAGSLTCPCQSRHPMRRQLRRPIVRP